MGLKDKEKTARAQGWGRSGGLGGLFYKE